MIGAVSRRSASVGIVVALSGCHQFFDLETVSLPPDANADAGPVGGRPSFCATGPLLDEFDGASFCYWAETYEEQHFSQHDSVLDIVGDGMSTFFAGCTGYLPLPFTDNGLFAHVPRVMDSENGYTELQIRNTYNTTPQMQATIFYVGGRMQFRVNDVVQMERDDAPAWWRLRRPGMGTTVAAEVSFDGITWEPFGSATAAMPPSFAIDMGAGIHTVPTTPGIATFAAIGVCD